MCSALPHVELGLVFKVKGRSLQVGWTALVLHVRHMDLQLFTKNTGRGDLWRCPLATGPWGALGEHTCPRASVLLNTWGDWPRQEGGTGGLCPCGMLIPRLFLLQQGHFLCWDGGHPGLAATPLTQEEDTDCRRAVQEQTFPIWQSRQLLGGWITLWLHRYAVSNQLFIYNLRCMW